MHKQLYPLRRKNGFTIVELVVVIAVIGILLAVTTLTYRQVQREARDNQRATAAATIASALETYYDKNGEYPAGAQFNTTDQPNNITNYGPTLSVLNTLADKNLSVPGVFDFYAYCNGTACDSGSWQTTRRQQITYHSRNTVNTTPGSFFTLTLSQSIGGPNCKIATLYDQPGFALIWYNESTNIWSFKKSNRGTVTISNNGTPTAPQTCTFS